jgi:hypothetical protein
MHVNWDGLSRRSGAYIHQEASMPLSPYLKGAVFDPEQIELTTAAFEGVCQSLQLTDPRDPFIEIVARNVVEIAGTGIHDSNHLRDLVLLALKMTDQRSA